MRPFRLARIAAEAEGVRLRGLVSRIATRAILGVIALFFVLGAITFGHVAAWYGLHVGLEQTFLVTAGELGGADLLVAIILAVLASRSAPSRVEVEALEVRRKAVQAIGGTFTMAQLLVPIVRMAVNLRGRRRA